MATFAVNYLTRVLLCILYIKRFVNMSLVQLWKKRRDIIRQTTVQRMQN